MGKFDSANVWNYCKYSPKLIEEYLKEKNDHDGRLIRT